MRGKSYDRFIIDEIEMTDDEAKRIMELISQLPTTSDGKPGTMTESMIKLQNEINAVRRPR